MIQMRKKNKIILKIFVIEIVILSYKFIEIYRKYWFNIGCINLLIIQLDKKKNMLNLKIYF